MKILAISDAHGDYSKVGQILKLKQTSDIDLILISGDITDFGPDEEAEKLLNMFEKPIMAIPGNCDLRTILKVLDNSKATSLHNTSKRIDDITFIGLGGSNPTPFNTPFELQEDEIESDLERLVKEAENNPNNNTIVLLTHAPPYGTVDEIPIGHVGSTAIEKFVGRVDLIVCGHIHEARGVMKVGKTVIVNPGMVCESNGAIITITGENKGNIQINAELIYV
ncbi:MAG: metallophosphoesterase [Methanosarcinaceae archaeon]|nr:metallophosphoesterase [Methanosarcinaceae archaeon]